MTREEADRTISLALGRIFRMGARPTQPGDLAEYARCRALVLDLADEYPDVAPNWARDRLRGAQGD